MPIRSRLVRATLAGMITATIAGAALAQPTEDAARSAARQLASDGDVLYEAGSYLEALDNFTRADSLVHAPSMQIRVARCLVKLGRLVEASERYSAIVRLDLPADAPVAFREAQGSAETELGALKARLPSLEVTVGAGGAQGASVRFDGQPLPPALIGIPFPVNPGVHHLEAKRGSSRDAQEVSVAEGESARVTLHLLESAAGMKNSSALVGAAEPSRGARTLGWVSIGVGAVGLAVGSTAGVLAIGQHRTLAARCPDFICPRSAAGDLDQYNTTAAVSTVGVAVGLVGAAVGIYVLYSNPARSASSPAAKPVEVSAWASPTAAGLLARF